MFAFPRSFAFVLALAALSLSVNRSQGQNYCIMGTVCNTNGQAYKYANVHVTIAAYTNTIALGGALITSTSNGAGGTFVLNNLPSTPVYIYVTVPTGTGQPMLYGQVTPATGTCTDIGNIDFPNPTTIEALEKPAVSETSCCEPPSCSSRRLFFRRCR